MKVSYDKEADVLYITLMDAPAIATEEIDGVFLRHNDAGQLAGITILDFVETYMSQGRAFRVNKSRGKGHIQ